MKVVAFARELVFILSALERDLSESCCKQLRFLAGVGADLTFPSL